MRRVLAGGGILGAVIYVWLIPGKTYDFGYDWLVANAFTDGVNPYQSMHDLAAHYGMTNLLDVLHPRIPGALILMSPIGLIPAEVFYEAGRLLTVASAVLLGWVVARIGGWDPLWSWTALPVVLLIWPFNQTLMLSQVEFLVAALIGATLMMVSRRPDWWAGIPLGLAVTLKMWPWLLIVALLVAQKWRPAIAAGLTIAALNLAGLSFSHVTLDGAVEALTTTWAVHGTRSISIAGTLGLPVSLLPFLAILTVWLLRRRAWDALYVVAIPIALISAPILWPTYLTTLVIPAAWLRKAHLTSAALPTRITGRPSSSTNRVTSG